jgi:hypothetical protein
MHGHTNVKYFSANILYLFVVFQFQLQATVIVTFWILYKASCRHPWAR